MLCIILMTTQSIYPTFKTSKANFFLVTRYIEIMNRNIKKPRASPDVRRQTPFTSGRGESLLRPAGANPFQVRRWRIPLMFSGRKPLSHLAAAYPFHVWWRKTPFTHGGGEPLLRLAAAIPFPNRWRRNLFSSSGGNTLP